MLRLQHLNVDPLGGDLSHGALSSSDVSLLLTEQSEWTD